MCGRNRSLFLRLPAPSPTRTPGSPSGWTLPDPDSRSGFTASGPASAPSASACWPRRPTANKHALEQADGTPFFVIGDTWYATGTNRFRWYDDDQERPMGPSAGFKDYVRYRKAQGYNWVNIIAAFP